MSIIQTLKNFLALLLGTTTVLNPSTTRNAISTTSLVELTSHNVSSLENATTIFVSLPSHHPDWTNQTVSTKDIDLTTYSGSAETGRIGNGTATNIGGSNQTHTSQPEVTTFPGQNNNTGGNTATNATTNDFYTNDRNTTASEPTNATTEASTTASEPTNATTEASTTASETTNATTEANTTASEPTKVTISSQPSNHTSEGSTEKPVSTTPSSGHKSLNGGQIAGIVIGVLLVVAILVGLAIFFIRKRSMTEDRRPLTA